MFNKALLLLTCLFLFGGSQMYAQNKKTKFADNYFEKFNFEAAAANYEGLLGNKKIDDEVYLLEKLGDCYRLMNDTEQAEAWYAKAVAKEGVPSEAVYQYAQMLRSNSKYAPAILEFQRYQSMEPEDEHVGEIIAGLQEVERLLQQNESYNIQITPINSGSSDFSPFVHEDILYFASNGYPTANSKHDVWTDKPFLQVYKVDVAGYDQFGDVQFLDQKKLNGTYHDGPLAVDPTNNDLYLTRNNYNNRKITKDGEKNVNLKVFRKTQSEDGKWDGDVIDDFPFNSDDYSVGHVSISKDGQTLYFASDMPHDNAQGGVDIYKATRDGDSWGNLENLGTEINSRGNERFPFINDDGHLFFASDGLPGLGGMDIFEAIAIEEGGWSNVINMGAPLNTNYDDFALFLKDEVREGYFTSNRPSEYGDDDIYAFKDEGIRLVGIVVDANTGEPICNSQVEMKLGIAQEGTMVTDCDGKFRFPVKPGNIYDFNACADDYGCNNDITASTKGLMPGNVVEVKIPLKQDIPIKLTVTVIDEKTKEPITTSRVNFYDGCYNHRNFRQSDENGQSVYDAMEGCEYMIGGFASTYFPKDTIISSAGVTEDMEVVIELSKDGMFDVADMGEEGIIFYDIYYDFDESYIRGDANPDLQVVYDFMAANTDVVVSIESHTDARAPYQYNIDLSKRRAAAAKDWLIAKGIDEKRLMSTGFGEIKPRNGCIDNVRCTEEEHQQNRRTEFRLVSGKIDTRSLQRFDVTVDPCLKCPF